MTKWKKNLSIAFKIALGVSLILYLVFSGNLNLHIIGKAINLHPWWFLLAASLLIIPLFLTSIRWQMLLLAQETNITLWKTLSLNFIGLFFNNFLPGGTGGDLAKCYYVASIYPDKKAATITTVLIDRFLGLSGLVLVGGICVLCYPKISLGGGGSIRAISFSILIGSAAILIGLVLFLNFPVSFLETYSEKLSHLPGGKLLLKFYYAVKIYRDHQFVLYLALFLSILVHTTIIIMTIIFGKIFGSLLSWRIYGVITPLGLLANALPIAPAGLGVGEAAFEYLYRQVGSPLGGEIMALFHLVSIFWGGMGFPFYLLFKKKPEPSTNINPSIKLENIYEG